MNEHTSSGSSSSTFSINQGANSSSTTKGREVQSALHLNDSVSSSPQVQTSGNLNDQQRPTLPKSTHNNNNAPGIRPDSAQPPHNHDGTSSSSISSNTSSKYSKTMNPAAYTLAIPQQQHQTQLSDSPSFAASKYKSQIESKITSSEVSGVILNPQASLYPPLSPSSMPQSPTGNFQNSYFKRNYNYEHNSFAPTTSSGLHSSHAGGSQKSISRTRSPTVIETRHISLEYDPVKKRKLLNTYEILSDLGSGQHGKVKLALDTVSGEKVAIKILDRAGRAKVGASKYFLSPKPENPDSNHNGSKTTDDSTFVSENEYKIRKEITIMKKCDHENVVKLKEVIDDHRLRKIYLVLEYLEKGEINWQVEESEETIINGKQQTITKCKPVLSFREARKVFRDVVLGLEYLHYQGIIHRDIKPANLLIAQDDTVKISDFGVSFSITLLENSEYELCKTAGTPAFYAPELCSYDSSLVKEDGRQTITHKVDIWALGVTLYCLMFGKLPFYGQNNFELFEKISKDNIIVPSYEEFQSYEIPQNINIDKATYDEMVDLLRKMLIKNPAERVDIPEIKDHEFVLRSLETEEDVYKYDNNLFIHNFSGDGGYAGKVDTDATGDSANGAKIDVSKEEMGNAITDIGNKLKSSLSKVLNLTGLTASTSSLVSKKSSTALSPGLHNPHTNNHNHNNNNNGSHHRHRLSISSVFSKKHSNHSQSNSTASSRKNSRSNTVFTPPHVQALRHEDSSLSLRSAQYSLNSDNSFSGGEYKASDSLGNRATNRSSVYMHSNLTGSSFISPSLQHSNAMNQSHEYFGSPTSSDKRVYSLNTATNSTDLLDKSVKNKASLSHMSSKSRTSFVQLTNHPQQTRHHRRSASNTSSVSNPQVSDTCIEGGFFVHTNPVANTLNGIIEKSAKQSKSHSQLHLPEAVKEGQLYSPPVRGMNSPTIFGLGSKLRNSSFLNNASSFGYNNGITLPRKSSNMSLPLNSSYASLNSIDDNFIYSNAGSGNASSTDTNKRMVGYSTPGYQGNQHDVSGFLNNSNSTSGFFNHLSGDASKFKFHEDSIKEKLYGRKPKNVSPFDNYDIKETMNKPPIIDDDHKPISPYAMVPSKDETRQGIGKVPSISTINEIQSTKNLIRNLRSQSNCSKRLMDSDDEGGFDDEDVLHYNPSQYKDKTIRGRASSRDNTDIESFNMNDYNELRMVDSIVTVPNSIISKLNSTDNSKPPSQSQLTSYYDGAHAISINSRGLSIAERRNPQDKKPSTFQFGGDDDDDDDDDESDDTDESGNSVSFFRNSDLLKGKRRYQSQYQSGYQSSNQSSEESDDNSQELTFNFATRKLISERKKSAASQQSG